MSAVSLVPMFLVGVAGSVHCVGMCGGIVGALSLGARPAPHTVTMFPLRQATSMRAAAFSLQPMMRVAAYNSGRLLSYATAGALAGGLAGGAVRLTALPQLQHGLLWAANLMLVALGLFLLDAWRGLAFVEALGQGLWKHIVPLLKLVRPGSGSGGARHARLFACGVLWGWLPCGMVYSALTTAMLSGSAQGGAAVMLAFGLGTLPMLALLGSAGQELRQQLQRPIIRRACGLLILAFGVGGLVRASGGAAHGWLDVLCITGGGA